MIKSLLIIITLLAAGIVSPAFADSLTLQSGATVEGRIIERTNEFIRIESGGSELLFIANEISAVNGEPFYSPVVWNINATNAAASAPEKEAAAPPSIPAAVQALLPEVFDPPAPAGASSHQLPQQTASRFPQPAKPYTHELSMPPWFNSLLALGAALAIGVFIFALFAIFFSCFCMMRMSQKSKRGKPWFAWVPIANFFLMCDLAGLSYVWVLIFFAGIIPIIGAIAGAVGYGFIWSRIARQFNRPAWMGWLMLLPLVGFVIMGILAFADAKEAPSGNKGAGSEPLPETPKSPTAF